MGKGRDGAMSMRGHTVRAVVMVLLLSASSVPGATAPDHRTLFVAPAGEGGGSCLTPDATTIGGAIELSGPGDTIEVCPGEYRELIVVTGRRRAGLTLRSTVPQGAVVLPPALELGEFPPLVSIQADRVTITGFDLAAGSRDGCTDTIIQVAGGSRTVIEGNLLRSVIDPVSGEGCIARTAVSASDAGVRVEGNIIEDPGTAGIEVSTYDGRSAIVTRNVIRCCAYRQDAPEPPDPDESTVDQEWDEACPGWPSGVWVGADDPRGMRIEGNRIEGRPGSGTATDAMPPWGTGICVNGSERTQGLMVERNMVRDAAVGIAVDWETVGARIVGNDVTGLSVACWDGSEAQDGQGTRNTWATDIATTGPEGELSRPEGLCVARPIAVAYQPVVRMVDDDGRVAADGDCDGSAKAFRRIQRAIDDSRPDDIVRVCPGTYTEWLTLTDARDGLVLAAAGSDHPVIRPPRRTAGVALQDLDAPMSLIRVDADGVTIEGFRLQPHGGSGRCDRLVRGEPEGALLEVGGNSSVTVRDTSFAAAEGSPTCSRYGYAVLASTDLSQVAIRLERVLVRDFEAAGVYVTAYGHGEPNELVVADSRFEVTRQPSGSDHEAVAVSFSGVHAAVTDTVVEVAPGIVANGVAISGDYDRRWTKVEIRNNRMSGVTNGVLIDDVGSGDVTGNVLAGSGAPGEGIHIWSDSLTVQGNVVSGFGGAGLVAGGTAADDEGTMGTPHAISDNDLRGNAGIDCVDGSAGPVDPDPSLSPSSGNRFTAGAPATSLSPSAPVPLLGVWSDNRGEESLPDGLCTP